MNRIIQYGSVESIPFFNCSRKTFDEWELTGVRRPLLGWSVLIFGVFVEILYIPILYIIVKTGLIRNPCYKIIMFLAVVDMNATVCSCLITGLFFIIGSVFCMYPTVTYIAGGYAMTTWAMACMATIFLFINRIVSIGLRKRTDFIEKKLAYFSILIVLIYGFYMIMFVPPILFNSNVMAYIPETLSEEVTAEATAMYKNWPHEFNNWGFTGCMFVLFTLYCGMVKKLEGGQKSKASKAIFIQCSIICFFNTCVAIIYVSLAFMTPPQWILVFCQLCWSVNHACPAFIYVTMNDTIRREFLRTVLRVKVTKRTDDVTCSTVAKKMSTHSIRKSSVMVI
ncbi:hypothetical protein CAEBREN_32584 [Caenorhabditis brenneri]|uniref:Uncharacterized protein n=1 Tax=Caenorhabditis brenneri TaxID=135651 RepID=G0NDR2_CAEBE|nr:hypothetical protein CAEBREN_32584 [Caenorhabditis brenneri]